jgi:beta-glucanase (GH16 family)
MLSNQVAPFILCALLAGQSIAQTPPSPLPGYKLVWSDDFSGNKLDLAKWYYRTDSKGLSTQKPENVCVSNGILSLNLKKEEAGTMHYTGAGIISRRLFNFGYYEARLKVPSSPGWHTSFWMMKYLENKGTSASQACQELDVIENDSKNQKSYSCNVHKWKDGHIQLGTKNIRTPILSEDFHVYGCEFTPTTVNYYFDGTLVNSVDLTKALKVSNNGTSQSFPFELGDQNIWLTSIGFGDPKKMDDSKLPTAAEYSWVRFYEKLPDQVVRVPIKSETP